MLFATSPRKNLCLPFSLPSFSVESTLYSLSSHSDRSFSCLAVALTHLDSVPSHNLITLFHFYLSKGLWHVATLFCFRQGHFVPSFSAKAYAILQALRWCMRHHQVFHFSSPLSRSLSSPFYFKHLWQKLTSPSSVTI